MGVSVLLDPDQNVFECSSVPTNTHRHLPFTKETEDDTMKTLYFCVTRYIPAIAFSFKFISRASLAFV